MFGKCVVQLTLPPRSQRQDFWGCVAYWLQMGASVVIENVRANMHRANVRMPLVGGCSVMEHDGTRMPGHSR